MYGLCVFIIYVFDYVWFVFFFWKQNIKQKTKQNINIESQKDYTSDIDKLQRIINKDEKEWDILNHKFAKQSKEIMDEETLLMLEDAEKTKREKRKLKKQKKNQNQNKGKTNI